MCVCVSRVGPGYCSGRVYANDTDHSRTRRRLTRLCQIASQTNRPSFGLDFTMRRIICCGFPRLRFARQCNLEAMLIYSVGVGAFDRVGRVTV